MRRKLFQFAAYAAAAIVLIGCTRNTLAQKEEGIPVIITPTIIDANSPGVDLASSKAKSGKFDTDDRLGLFLVTPTQGNINSLEDAQSKGNYFSRNHQMTVGSDGKMTGTELYYIGRDAVLDFYSYYPYDATLTGDPAQYNFTVKTEQNTLVNYNLSDLCYSKALGISASDPNVVSGSANLTYRHTLSQLIFDFTIAKSIGGRTVTGIQSVSVSDVETKTRFNLAHGTLHAPAGNDYQNNDIAAYLVSGNNNNPNDDKTYISTYALVLPPQDIASSKNFIEIVLILDNSNTASYWYTTSSAISYGAGESLKYVLTISDSESAVKLEADPIIGNWNDVNITIGGNGGTDGEGNDWGGLGSEINNNFTVYWDKPVAGYEATEKVTITIRNPNTGEEVSYTIDITDKDVTDPDFGIIKFPLVDDDASIGYPFEIVGIDFEKGDGTVIESSESMTGTLVTGSGDYTIAVAIDNIIEIVSGDITVDNWNDLFEEGLFDGLGVLNTFRLRLLETGVVGSDITGVVFTIGNTDYTLSGQTLVQSNGLYVELSGLGFTGLAAPSEYPFTISKVKLNGAGGLLKELNCNVSVNSVGAIEFDLSL